MKYVSDITKQNYTKSEFLGMIEKRIRKHLRIDNLIDLKKSYAILNRNNVASEILMYFLQNIFSKRISIRFIEDLTETEEEEIFLSSQYLEEHIQKKADVFFKGLNISILYENNSPLRVISAKEINQLAEILSLKGEKVVCKNEFIEKLQQKYPQTKTSFLKSFDNLSDEILKF